MKLKTQLIAHNKKEDGTLMLVLRTHSFESADITESIPDNVTLEIPAGVLSFDTSKNISITLGIQPLDSLLTVPEIKTPDQYDKAPLHADTVERTESGVTVKFVRNKDIPNPNCYDAFFGKTPVGYVRLPFHSLLWGNAVRVKDITLAKFTANTFEEATTMFCAELAKIWKT